MVLEIREDGPDERQCSHVRAQEDTPGAIIPKEVQEEGSLERANQVTDCSDHLVGRYRLPLELLCGALKDILSEINECSYFELGLSGPVDESQEGPSQYERNK